jgi:hypothetical protein
MGKALARKKWPTAVKSAEKLCSLMAKLTL